MVVTATAITIAGFSLGWFLWVQKCTAKKQAGSGTETSIAEDTRSFSPSTFGSDRLPDQIAFDRGPCVAPSAMEASKSKRRKFLTRFCGVAPKIRGAAAAMKTRLRLWPHSRDVCQSTSLGLRQSA